MTVLINRPARFNLEVPLCFKTGDDQIIGQTLNVSESGLLVRFPVPLDIWVVGQISLTVGEYYIEIDARVARAQDNDYGLSFLIEDDNDRLAIRILNDFAVTGVVPANAGQPNPDL